MATTQTEGVHITLNIPPNVWKYIKKYGVVGAICSMLVGFGFWMDYLSPSAQQSKATTAPSTPVAARPVVEVYNRPPYKSAKYIPAINAALDMMKAIEWHGLHVNNQDCYKQATRYMSPEFQRRFTGLSPFEFYTGGAHEFGWDNVSFQSKAEESSLINNKIWVPFVVYRTADPDRIVKTLFIVVDPLSNKVIERHFAT